MAGFTFEKLEKGKTEPQFLLKKWEKVLKKLDFFLILKLTCFAHDLQTIKKIEKELRALKQLTGNEVWFVTNIIAKLELS